jgi:ribosomal protein S18 acetylase RimI-like enzyme
MLISRRLQSPPGPAIPPGVHLERVVDAAGAARFAAVHKQVFRDSPRPPITAGATGHPVEPVLHFAAPGALLNAAAFVARVGNQPVAAAMAVISGPGAGVYWVATRADARRRGFGELVTRAAVRAGFEAGAEVVVLQATEQGMPLCRRLGFTAFTKHRRYVTQFYC